MQADEVRLLEEIGAYYCALSMVPIEWHQSQQTSFQLTRDEHDNVIESWWEHYSRPKSIFNFCDREFARCEHSRSTVDLEEVAWCDENDHRVELWESESGTVEHLDVRIDVRNEYSSFVKKIVEFAIHASCIFFESESSRFLDPSSTAVLDVVAKSRASALVALQGQLARPN